MSNIIDSIRLSGTTYQIQGEITVDATLDSGSTNPVENKAIYNKFDEVEQVTAAALNELNDAISGKQNKLVADRGITITTGETADTVSFNLPIYSGSGTNAIVMNHSGNTASGTNSHAEGRGTTASGTNSHAEGRGTTASGNYSHAEGGYTVASGYSSHAEGADTKADGIGSHAEGVYTTASGDSSHAEGSWTQANGNASHTEGHYTTANGNYSHTEGYYTTANNESEHASGQYNISNSATTEFGDSGNTLFSVGNGTADDARHNAFEIRQNGDIYLSSGGTDIKLQDHLGGGGSVTVDSTLSPTSENPVQNKVIYNKFDEVEEVTAAGLNALNDKITPTVELTQAQYDALVDKDPNTYYIITDAEAGDLTNYYTKTETNTLLGSKADTATTYTKTEVDTALGGKQATLVSGTNIKTINNESILGSGNIDIQGGGGKAVSGGTNISITTGETADTINCTLPYYKVSDTDNYTIYGSTAFKNKATYAYSTMFIGGSNEVNGNSASRSYTNNSVIGYNNKINSNITSYSKGNNVVIGGHNSLSGTNLSYSYVIGSYNSGYTSNTLLTGWYNQAHNAYESSFGKYNASNTGSTDADKSLFSVGNGTSTSARHNAFEIRQNGDIYLTKDGQDVKLQDQLGGGGTVDQTIISGSTNAVAGGAVYDKFDEVEQVTAAGLNALNDNFGGLKLVKLTQAEYNALATKDSSTLYIIVN